MVRRDQVSGGRPSPWLNFSASSAAKLAAAAGGADLASYDGAPGKGIGCFAMVATWRMHTKQGVPPALLLFPDNLGKMVAPGKRAVKGSHTRVFVWSWNAPPAANEIGLLARFKLTRPIGAAHVARSYFGLGIALWSGSPALTAVRVARRPT